MKGIHGGSSRPAITLLALIVVAAELALNLLAEIALHTGRIDEAARSAGSEVARLRAYACGLTPAPEIARPPDARPAAARKPGDREDQRLPARSCGHLTLALIPVHVALRWRWIVSVGRRLLRRDQGGRSR